MHMPCGLQVMKKIAQSGGCSQVVAVEGSGMHQERFFMLLQVGKGLHTVLAAQYSLWITHLVVQGGGQLRSCKALVGHTAAVTGSRLLAYAC